MGLRMARKIALSMSLSDSISLAKVILGKCSSVYLPDA